MLIRLLIFLVLNFAALGLGGLLMGNAVAGDWYQNLNKAPWTPPGWVFGAAWTTIMACFSFYMASAWAGVGDKRFLLALFAAQWLLNVAWNPVFFRFHMVGLGLVIIIGLTVLVGYLLFAFYPQLRLRVLWVLPYFLWLLVATSLNAYVLVRN